MREELVNRLGPERWGIVNYGRECKDANEDLVKYGAESFRIAIEQAEEIYLEGIFTAAGLHRELRTLYDNSFSPGADTGWEEMDKFCSYGRCRLLIVTGTFGSRKSEWIDGACVMPLLVASVENRFFSLENVPIVYHLCKLIEKLTGHRFKNGYGMSDSLLALLEQFLTNNVSHISLKGSITRDRMLAKTRKLVVCRGCRIVVLDSLNRFDHTPQLGQTKTQYLSNLLDKF